MSVPCPPPGPFRGGRGTEWCAPPHPTWAYEHDSWTQDLNAKPPVREPGTGEEGRESPEGLLRRRCPWETPGDSAIPECTPRVAPTTPHHLALETGPAHPPCSVWCWLAARCWRRWPRWRPRPARWWSRCGGKTGGREGTARGSPGPPGGLGRTAPEPGHRGSVTRHSLRGRTQP